MGRDCIFDEAIERRGTGSMKWERYPADCIPLWVADTDFRTPECVTAAVQAELASTVLGYTEPTEETVRAVVDHLQGTYGHEVHRSWLLWFSNIVPALTIAASLARQRGGTVLTNSPVYPPILQAAGRAGCPHIDVPLSLHGSRYTFDVPAMHEAAEALRGAGSASAEGSEPSHLLFLCNPHNPVGRAYDAAELGAVADLAEQHNLMVVSDEIHCGLIYSKPHIPAYTLPQLAQRSITLMGPTKTYNLAGLPSAFAVVPSPALRAAFRGACEGLMASVSTLGFAACRGAYLGGEPWRRELLDYLAANYRLLAQPLATHAPQLKLYPLEATYLAWIDARGLGEDDPQAFFLQHAKVALSDGRQFGAPGFVRLNLGCRRSLLVEAVGRMVEAVGGMGC